MLEASKTHPWILSENSSELREWLRLLPFAKPVTEALDIVRGLPDDQRRPMRLEEMIVAFGAAPGQACEDVLFQLAEADPRLYRNHAWRNAILGRDSPSAARRFVDLAANSVFDDKGVDRWHVARQLGSLMAEHPEVRAHVYELLRNGLRGTALALFARAASKDPDEECLLLLIKLEAEHKRLFTSPLMIEHVVTEHVASEDWQGAFNISPVPAVELRRKLLAMTTDGGASDVAARCLTQIDKIRDEYGIPDLEPRHPDITSGKAWPIMACDPDAETAD